MKREEFDRELARLRLELVKLQDWITANGREVVVLFEGCDARGQRRARSS